MNCIFCKIANKEILSSIVYETENVIAILDLSQANMGHTLIMPKEHYKNFLELPEEVAKDLALATLKVAKAIDSSIHPDGINILNNCNEAAGQVVMHVHIHIIPRFKDDGITIQLTNNEGKYNLEEVAAKIKKALA